MNGITRNELSFDVVKLDYDALLKTSAFAQRELRERVSQHLRSLNEATIKNDSTSQYLQAQWLSQTARELAIATDTYAALFEGVTRKKAELRRSKDSSEIKRQCR